MTEIIEKIKRFYPAFMSPKDLVDLGLWGTRSSLSIDMKKEGYTPPLQIRRSIARYRLDSTLSSRC